MTSFPLNVGTIRISFVIGSLNNYKPIFSQNGYEFAIDKNVSIGTKIGQLEAIDPDLYSYGTTRFKITDKDTPFSLDMKTGDLFLSQRLKEGVVQYKLNVMVYDLGADSKSSKTTVEIKVKQNTKRFPFREVVSECIFIGIRSTSHCRIKLTNRQLNAKFRLIPDDSFQPNSLSSGRGNFQISPTTGEIEIQNSHNGTFYYSVCITVAPDIQDTISANCGKLIILGKFSNSYYQ